MKTTPLASTEFVLINTLKTDPANLRKHPVRNLAAIKSSLTRFGWQKPIVIDDKNVVIAGNGSLLAARELGMKKVPCVRSSLLGPERVAYAIADNRAAELAEWGQRPRCWKRCSQCPRRRRGLGIRSRRHHGPGRRSTR